MKFNQKLANDGTLACKKYIDYYLVSEIPYIHRFKQYIKLNNQSLYKNLNKNILGLKCDYCNLIL